MHYHRWRRKSLYKFGSCVSLCLSVRHIFLHIHSSANWTRIFTKPSAYIKFGLQNRLKLSRLVHVTMCMHRAWKRAPYFCTFFATFFHQLFEILKPFLTENEKIDATLEKDIDQMQLFCFIHFFQFSKEVLQNGRNVAKNVKNFTLLTPGGQNMKLRNKCPEIKKIYHVL